MWSREALDDECLRCVGEEGALVEPSVESPDATDAPSPPLPLASVSEAALAPAASAARFLAKRRRSSGCLQEGRCWARDVDQSEKCDIDVVGNNTRIDRGIIQERQSQHQHSPLPLLVLRYLLALQVPVVEVGDEVVNARNQLQQPGVGQGHQRHVPDVLRQLTNGRASVCVAVRGDRKCARGLSSMIDPLATRHAPGSTPARCGGTYRASRSSRSAAGRRRRCQRRWRWWCLQAGEGIS